MVSIAVAYGGWTYSQLEKSPKLRKKYEMVTDGLLKGKHWAAKDVENIERDA